MPAARSSTPGSRPTRRPPRSACPRTWRSGGSSGSSSGAKRRRIAWTPDTVRIELLGAREAQPLLSNGLQLPPPDLAGMLPALAFDPVDAEMLLRVDTTVIRHPLAPGSDAYYRFAGGDSTTIRLPDGRQVRLRELRITARRADPQVINGSFWVDAETHAVVRAAFRLSRGISTSQSDVSLLAPELTGEVDHVAIDYGLWDMRWWLPRAVVARGVIRVMGGRFPLAYERSYHGCRVQGDTLAAAPRTEVASVDAAQRPCRPGAFGSIGIQVGGPSDRVVRDSVWSAAWDRSAARLLAADTTAADTTAAGTTSADTAKADARPRCDRAFIVTRADGADLIASPVFEASIYDEDAGPVSAQEMHALAGLRAIPDSPWSLGRPSVQLLTPELVRANRVEGLSLGARGALPLGPAELRGEVHAGTTGEVGTRLAGLYSTPGLRSELALYRGLEAVQMAAQPFALTSTVSALLLGRDENDYFRGTGAELRFSPSLSRRVATHGGMHEARLREAGIAYDVLGPGFTEARCEAFVRSIPGIGPPHESMWSDEEIRRYVAAEVAYFREHGIRVAVTGWTLTALLSTRVAGIPLVTEHAGSMLPPLFERGLLPAPSNPVGLPLERWLPEGVRRWLINFGTERRTIYTDGFNRVARELGVIGIRSFPALLLGDLTLVTDVPEVFGIAREEVDGWRPRDPRRYRPGTRLRYTGPLYARFEVRVPERVERFLAGPRPIIYVAITSSPAELVRGVLGALERLAVRVLVGATVHDLRDLESDRVMVAGILPNHEVMPHLDLAITASGQGSVQTALASGVPLIGIPLQPEQDANVVLAERQGAARRIPQAVAASGVLAEAVREMLADDSYRRNALRLRAAFEGTDGPGAAAEAILELLRPARERASGAEAPREDARSVT